MQINTPVSMLF